MATTDAARHVAGDVPESAPQRTSAADVPPDDAEAQRGAASGSQPPEHDPLGPWYRATCRVAVEH